MPTGKRGLISRTRSGLARWLPLLFSLATVVTVHAHDFAFTTYNGAVTITKYTGSGGAVIIPGAIDGLPVTMIRDHAFDHCVSVTGVTIPDSVLGIEDWAFGYCTNLTNITIGKRVTRIGDNAFDNCSGLTSVMIPDRVTRIGAWSFFSCSSLTHVTIGNGLTSVADHAFYNCNSLVTVSFGNRVTTIGSSAFEYGYNLSSVTVPDTVLCIGDSAFASCGMASVTLGNSVTNIRYGAFERCGNLTRVTIPDQVTGLGASAFASCTNLTDVVVGENVASLGDYAFFNCNRLGSVYFRGNAPAVGSDAFFGDTHATVYCLPWAEGWEATLGGRPAQLNPAYSSWRTTDGFPTNGLRDSIDSDGDGVLNWQEFLACVEPTKEADSLAIAAIGSGVASSSNGVAKANVACQVMKNLYLAAWGNTPQGGGADQQTRQTASTDRGLQYADPTCAGATGAAYRITGLP